MGIAFKFNNGVYLVLMSLVKQNEATNNFVWTSLSEHSTGLEEHGSTRYVHHLVIQYRISLTVEASLTVNCTQQISVLLSTRFNDIPVVTVFQPFIAFNFSFYKTRNRIGNFLLNYVSNFM
jgi:hypothetical protein